MHELLGIVLGVAIGSGVSTIRPRRLRATALVPAIAAAGLLTSAVNGELGSGLAGLFVAADTLLDALGVAIGMTLAPRLAYRLGRAGR